MQDYSGTPIERDQAWNIFNRWQSSGQEIGVIFWGRSGNLYTLGCVDSARNGRLLLKSETTRASFNLTEATFRYGPMQTWPRWPSPPIVEVIALRAKFADGDYLVLAEGLRPESMPLPALPA